MEVECTHCSGRMLIEEISGVVACPHCGTHLAVPSSFEMDGRSSVLTEVPADVGEVTQIGRPVDTPVDSVLQTSLPLEPSDHLPTPEATDSDTSNSDESVSTAAAPSDFAAPTVDTSGETQHTGTESLDGPSPSEDVLTFPALGETFPSADVVDVPTFSDSRPAESLPEDSAPAAANFAFPILTPSDSSEEPSTESVDESASGEATAESVSHPVIANDVEKTSSTGPLEGRTTGPVDSLSATSSPPGVSRFLFVLVASYASAATLAIIILIINLLHARQHSLESLPDLKPPVHNGKTAFQLVPEEAPMPPGHTLRLGQSQRFGSLRVTPLRVTRGPVEFVYFSEEPGHHRPPTPPTLKLRLRFENISDDQTFAPLGRELVLTRVAGKRPADQLRANNFVCRAGHRDGRRVLLFDLAQGSNWDLRNQAVDRVLKPGEVLETYLASEAEGLKELTGELIWRVHFRKGYNPKSKRGVTTLIEVRFDSKEIQPDTTG